jgi:phosphoribosylformylglycinamidine (FGAM) synthase-like amidotransferase family enzyme|tara:strand:- start:1179 stop:1610 length:432 start_codon:yes stop_codon:yes gene_type:complete
MSTVIKPKRSFTPLAIPASNVMEIGELAMNASDGKFYTKLQNGTVKELGGAGSVILQDVTTNGNISTNDIILNGSNLVFEGLLENAFETTLKVVEPTGDRIVRLPNVSGDVITTGNLTKDGTATGDPLAAEGDAVAFAIALGG